MYFLYRPTTDVKVAMAKAIVDQFPMLDNDEGDAHVSLMSIFLSNS
jgi:hypothetical protein